MKYKKVILVSVLTFFSSFAYAYKECEVSLTQFYVGDGGLLALNYTGSAGDGSAYIFQSNNNVENVDYKSYLALATTALTAGKKIKIRFNDINTSCTSTANRDVRGMWLLPN